MKFVVAPEIFELFPGLKLSVAVAEGVYPSADTAGVEGLWRQSWEDAARSASDHDNPQSHPRVAAWRTAMSEIGISGRKFPSSIESLIRRAFKAASRSPSTRWWTSTTPSPCGTWCPPEASIWRR